MHIWAVILAAGSGSRLAGHTGSLSKQFLQFRGAPLFWASALAFSRLPLLRGLVFVFPPACQSGEESRAGETLVRELDAGGRLGLPWRVAYGGARRQDSVRNALGALPRECDAVLIHDGARPFASPALAGRVMDALAHGHGAVIPGIPVTDTVKSVDERALVTVTHERARLRAVQTPQGFTLSLLRAAHEKAEQMGWEATDDAGLMERCGAPVLVVDGETANRKITVPEDLALLAEEEHACGLPALLPCTGFGYDVHRYGGDRPFILGGVPIRCDTTVQAHSDGDTLLHALIDALLGLIGSKDIGALFPDDDPAFDNMASGVLLAETLALVEAARVRLTHADITIVAQTPRIAPHREAIAANVAKLLDLPRSWVNVKATTEEKLGFTGEKKGIKVMAVVSALKPNRPAPDGKETAKDRV